MTLRPRWRASVRPIRRGMGTVQLGPIAGSGGLLLTGLAPDEVALLERLDGSLTEADLYALAADRGIDGRRAEELLGVLRDQRLLAAEERRAGLDAREREGRHVVVDGEGRLTAAVAALIRTTGLLRVDAGPWAADVADAELRSGSAEPVERLPSLVVLVADGAVDPRAGVPWRRRGVPVLPVVADVDRVVVGPLVGDDPLTPCLECLRLARPDAETWWPASSPSSPSSPESPGSPRPGDVLEATDDPALVSAAAGVATMVALAALSPGGVPPGVSVEVAGPWPRLDHRRWQRHPACSTHTGARRR